MPLEVALLTTEAPPLYQQIAAKALHLHQLGLTYFDVARKLGVNDKTVVPGIEENSYSCHATIHSNQLVIAFG